MNIQSLNKCIINLPERTDRLLSVEQEINHVFTDSAYHLIPGVLNKIPMLGIAEAHMNCVRMAKEQGWPEVLIMEDDVCFPAKGKTIAYLNEALACVPEDWQVILGGLSETDGLKQVNAYWNLTKQFCGLHFYILRESAYDRILSYPGQYHIDRWLNMNNELKCYVTKKMFAIQSNGFSDNVRMRVDYSDKFKRFEILK